MNAMLVINCMIMLIINIIFFVAYEWLHPTAYEILPMVVMCALAIIGRTIFAVIPQVQPVTAIVIIMGAVYGCRRGYVFGALCAFMSNMVLGQGPWTLFQMVAWGMIGCIAGAIGHVLSGKKEGVKVAVFAIYGFISAYIFSLICDFLTICYIGENINAASVVAVYLSGFAFAMAHAVFNSVFIVSLYGVMSRRLERVRKHA